MVEMNQSPSSLDCFNMSTLLLENSGAIIFGLCLIVCILYCLVSVRCRRDLVGLPPRITGRPVYAGGAVASSAAGDGGLSQLAIDALPSFAFGRGGDVDSCAVCLSLVTEGEMVRLLPDCGHTFHVECIDAWLQSHSMCPLCRKEPKPPPPPSPPKEEEEDVELGRDRGGSSPPGLV